MDKSNLATKYLISVYYQTNLEESYLCSESLEETKWIAYKRTCEHVIRILYDTPHENADEVELNSFSTSIELLHRPPIAFTNYFDGCGWIKEERNDETT